MMNTLALYARWWTTWKTLPVRPWVIAASHYRMGAFAEAQRWYEIGLRKHPKHPARHSARLDLAFCLQRQGSLDEAKFHLQHVMNHEPRLKESYLRMARLQLMLGHGVEASWTMRRAFRRMSADGELVGLYLHATLEGGSVHRFKEEALELARKLSDEEQQNALLRFALLRHSIEKREIQDVWKELSQFIQSEPKCVEACLYFADILFNAQQQAQAKYFLQRALSLRPDHPGVLAQLARLYLEPGEGHSPSYALQLAQSACQAAGWRSPRALHTLAKAYHLIGDKMSALLVASRAKDVGSSLMGHYREEQHLNRFIEELSSGTVS